MVMSILTVGSVPCPCTSAEAPFLLNSSRIIERDGSTTAIPQELGKAVSENIITSTLERSMWVAVPPLLLHDDGSRKSSRATSTAHETMRRAWCPLISRSASSVFDVLQLDGRKWLLHLPLYEHVCKSQAETAKETPNKRRRYAQLWSALLDATRGVR